MSHLLTRLSAFLVAQETGGPAPIPSSVHVENVWDFIVKGGWMMIPIGLCSLIMLTVVAERLISLRRKRIIPRGFRPGLLRLLEEDRGDVAGAREYCRRDGSPVAAVFAAALRHLGAPMETVQFHVQEAGQRQVLRLRKHLRVLSVVAAVSPLLGLLGTILGMITAFQTVALSPDALGKTELLAGGIYEAMITTAAGLIVAIPALVSYHWLSSIVQRLVMDIDEMSMDFVEEFIAPAASPSAVSSDGTAREGSEMRIAT